MIEYLQLRFKQGKLGPSWLIQTNDAEQTLADLEEFVRSTLLSWELSLTYHPDFKIIAKQTLSTSTKNISVEQIRSGQEFLNKTSAMNGNKVVIIYQADLMNLNAANCCLKILEDAPSNSYIFLITTAASAILATIRSRCAKLSFTARVEPAAEQLYQQFIALLAPAADPHLELNFIKELSDNNRQLWASFTNHVLHLISKMLKKLAGCPIKLSQLEAAIINQFSAAQPADLIEKFEDICRLINQTIIYDLDLKVSCILLIRQFKC